LRCIPATTTVATATATAATATVTGAAYKNIPACIESFRVRYTEREHPGRILTPDPTPFSLHVASLPRALRSFSDVLRRLEENSHCCWNEGKRGDSSANIASMMVEFDRTLRTFL